MATEFSLSPVGSDLSLGQRLQARREELKLSLVDIERRTKIGEEILSSIEADQLDDLPGVYAQGFLRNYALVLGLDPDAVVSPYRRERRIREFRTIPISPTPLRLFEFTGRHLWILCVATLLTLIAAFMVRQVVLLGEPPELLLRDAEISTSGLAALEGAATPGSRVSIAGIPVVVSPEGRFKAQILLSAEERSLPVAVRSEFGAETSRSVKLPAATSSSAPPEGKVRVTVTIGSDPVWLTVRSPLGLEFEGVGLPGAVASFAGQEIIISSSDGGSTSLRLTNERGEALLGPIGERGEKKENLRFLPTTQVQ